MRTALICHQDNPLNREILPRFLASFSDLAGIVVVQEPPARFRARLRHEWRRSGLRVVDVFAFRLWYRVALSWRDRAWVRARVAALRDVWPDRGSPQILEVRDPNSEQTRAFLESIAPELVVARCKTLLRREIFDIPRDGTFVIHPGICPEYRNAHGCFWALARRDLDRVGATLLRIDDGLDTGPVFAYYSVPIDEVTESHVMIQHRVVFENLALVKRDLEKIHAGGVTPIDVSGRESTAWGQPRLTDYVRWKRAARRARRSR